MNELDKAFEKCAVIGVYVMMFLTCLILIFLVISATYVSFYCIDNW